MDDSDVTENAEGRDRARFRNAGSANPRAQRTRRLLTDAMTAMAQERWAEGSDAAMTPAAICARAGVSPSSFYGHFNGVGDLARASLRDSLESVELGYIERAGGSDEQLDEASLRQVFEDLLAQFDPFRGLITEAFGPGGDAGELIRIYQRSVEISLRRRLPALPPRGFHKVSTFLAGGILALYASEPSAEERESVLDALVAVVPIRFTAVHHADSPASVSRGPGNTL